MSKYKSAAKAHRYYADTKEKDDVVQAKRESRKAQWIASLASEAPEELRKESSKKVPVFDLDQIKEDVQAADALDAKAIEEQNEKNQAEQWKRDVAEAEAERAMVAAMTPEEREMYDAMY